MKRIFLSVLAAMIVIALILSGCSSATPTQAPAPAPATSAAPAPTMAPAPAPTSAAPASSAPAASKPATSAPAGVITIKHSEESPVGGWYGQHVVVPWMADIERATGGKVKIELYDSQTLTKTANALTAVKTGVADSVWVMHGLFAGVFPLSDVITLPFLPLKSAEHATAVFWKLYDKFPSIQAEYKDYHVLMISPSQPYFLVTTKKQVKTVADFSGLKLRIGGGPPTDMMKALGAAPVMMGMPDTYTNLQKGVIDGMAIPWEALYTFKQYEVVKYYTYVPIFAQCASKLMNPAVWNKLSPDLQQGITSVCGVEGSKFWGKNQFDTIEQAARDAIKASKAEMVEYTIPDSEYAKMAEIAKPIWDKWVADNKAAGHADAQDILNAAVEFAKTTK